MTLVMTLRQQAITLFINRHHLGTSERYRAERQGYALHAHQNALVQHVDGRHRSVQYHRRRMRKEQPMNGIVGMASIS